MVVSASVVGCGSNDESNGGGRDAGILDAAGDGGPTDAWTWTPSFTDEVVEGLSSEAVVGDFAEMVLSPSGEPSIAYGYVPAASDVPEIHFAQRSSASGTWTTERVVIPAANEPQTNGTIRGLGLGYVDGLPHVVYIGGDDDDRGVISDLTDLMLSTRSAGGTWSERTLVDTSGEAPGVCPGTQDTCNFGNVVGSNAAIAVDAAGSAFAVSYRDTHGGFALEDLRLSDVEVYSEGGPFQNSNVDPVSSGGDAGNILFTASNKILVVYNREVALTSDPVIGVWAALYDAGTWTKVKVWDQPSGSKLRLAQAPDGLIYMAIYDQTRSDLVLASSDDDGMTWTTETIESIGYTGLHPSVAIDLEGDPVIAYTYCGPAGGGCSTLGAKSEVRVTRKKGGSWITRRVHDGQGFGGVGYFTSVQVLADGKLVFAFQDSRNSDLVFVREE
ncbi:MAG: exo-alpha-sialidase [Deltaproteobacteria bacterium]|nr:exo-alpha-sialidase [Deltaproteobacteria bacterium]